MQRLADSGNTRGFFNATKAVYGPSYRGLNPLRSKDGQTLLKDNVGISSRWQEQFQEFLNKNTTVELETIDQIPQRPIMDHLGDPPTENEVRRPNYRGISLLSTTGKVLTRILANRLLPLSEDILAESQCGFCPGRGTSDMIFAACQLQEKCREQHLPLYMAFIDLTKAFDSVNRTALWCALSKIGCPDKYLRILRLLHEDMTATVVGKTYLRESSSFTGPMAGSST